MSKDLLENIADDILVYKIVETKNQHLFGILYDRYAHAVYNKCLSFVEEQEEAQDMTHDIFVKLFVKLKTYQSKSKFSTWLYSFTYNFCVNHIQRKIKEERKNYSVTDDLIDNYNDELIDDKEIFELKIEKLTQSLKELDVEDKSILLMKYQDEFSIKEISDTLEIGESATKMRLNRTKNRLLKIYNAL
ncbi:RNA polymerase sigma factor [Empedobacter brevis]